MDYVRPFNITTLGLREISFDEYRKRVKKVNVMFAPNNSDADSVYCEILNPFSSRLPDKPGERDFLFFVRKLAGRGQYHRGIKFRADELRVFSGENICSRIYTRKLRFLDTQRLVAYKLGESTALSVHYHKKGDSKEENTRLGFSRLDGQFISSTIMVPPTHIDLFPVESDMRNYRHIRGVYVP